MYPRGGASLLLMQGFKKKESDLNSQDEVGQTKLHRVVDVGDEETLKKLIAARADLNIKDKNGDTPLILAAANDDADFVKLLLDAKADFTIRNRQGATAQVVARMCNTKRDFLAEQHLRMAGAENLHLAILDKDFEKVKELAKKASPAELNRFYLRQVQVDEKKSEIVYIAPPLHTAASLLSYDTVKFLLTRKGVDINAKERNAQTALQTCIDEANFQHTDFRKVFDLLYKNTEICLGVTALHFACYVNKFEIVKMLVNEYDEDILAKNAWGESPLDLARGKVKEFLLSRLNECKLPELIYHPRTIRRNSWYDCLGEEYDKIKPLGGGSSGGVFLAEKVTSNSEYKLPSQLAVKMHVEGGPLPIKDLREEAECNKKVHGFSALGDKCFAMPLIEGRTLVDFQTVKLENALAICIAMLDAVDKLHNQHKRIHEDINWSNFLIKETTPNKYEASLVDFGLTTKIRHLIKMYYAGHDGYFAPELKTPEAAKPAHDIYALGRLFKEYFVNFTKDLTFKPQFANMFNKMMSKNPLLRPTVAHVREFFNNEIRQLTIKTMSLTSIPKKGLFSGTNSTRKIDEIKPVTHKKQPWRVY
ncbi:MAG: ankyrin repeat and protein kinase domain-containing protein [Gammaproteobacteria bacterium]